MKTRLTQALGIWGALLVAGYIGLNHQKPSFANDRAHTAYIEAQSRRASIDDKLRLLTTAADIETESALPAVELGNLYFHSLGQYDNAERAYQKALSLQVENAEVHYRMADILLFRSERSETDTLSRKLKDQAMEHIKTAQQFSRGTQEDKKYQQMLSFLN